MDAQSTGRDRRAPGPTSRRRICGAVLVLRPRPRPRPARRHRRRPALPIQIAARTAGITRARSGRPPRSDLLPEVSGIITAIDFVEQFQGAGLSLPRRWRSPGRGGQARARV